MSRDAVAWVYLPNGRVRHALHHHSVAALCGLLPPLDGDWWGTGSQEEYERVAKLSECRRCAARVKPAAGAST